MKVKRNVKILAQSGGEDVQFDIPSLDLSLTHPGKSVHVLAAQSIVEFVVFLSD
jgi:hypothetical protein